MESRACCVIGLGIALLALISSVITCPASIHIVVCFLG